MQFIPTAEGRVLPPALSEVGSWAYEYSYKDHLGNLCVVFRPGSIHTYTATMERSQAATEERLFSNLSDAIRVPSGCTGGGVKLTSIHPMGPMRILKVRRGDVVTAKVKGWYSTPASSNTGSALNLWLQAIPGRNVSGQSENSQTFPSLQVGLTLNTPTGVPSNAPKAYLQLQAYDEQSQPAGQQTRFVAEQNSCLTDLLIDGYKVEQDGYIRVYVASESDAPAFFDQLEITHNEALITQENHFSAFGSNLVGIEKIGQPDHKYQYMSQEKQVDLGLNWIQTDYRMYDPQLGRFHALDPLSDFFEDLSPYHYSYNNPVTFSDPSGMCPECDDWAKKNNVVPQAGTTYTTQGGWAFVHNGKEWVGSGGTLPEVTVSSRTNRAPSSSLAEQVFPAAGEQVLPERKGFLGNLAQVWNGNRSFNGLAVGADGKTTGELTPVTGEPFLPTSVRGALSAGGFAVGIAESEIVAINKTFGGTMTLGGHPSTAIAAAARYTGFYKKVAAMIKSIAHGHMFDNGNKRTAQAVYQLLAKKNGISTGASADKVRQIINRVVTGELTDIDEIAKLLRGF